MKTAYLFQTLIFQLNAWELLRYSKIARIILNVELYIDLSINCMGFNNTLTRPQGHMHRPSLSSHTVDNLILVKVSCSSIMPVSEIWGPFACFLLRDVERIARASVMGLFVGLFSCWGLVEMIAGADMLRDFLLACFLKGLVERIAGR